MPCCFVTCGPNEVLVVSGCCHRKPALIVGGRIFVCPFFKMVDVLPLNLMTVVVESPKVYTSQGVPISVTGVAQIKIQGQNEEMLWIACEMFLGKEEEEIANAALVTLEGHQRAIMGTMTVEEIYKDRKKFSENVFEVASSDLINMGIAVVSYTLKDIRDDNGYLISLGMERTAQVKRDGRIGEAEANRDSRIKEAKAEMERMASRLLNDTEIARAKRDFELKKAEYEVESLRKKADAENAFELRALQIKQKIVEEKTGVDIIEKIQKIALEEQEILRKRQELDATVRVPADAEKYRVEILAEANLRKVILEAEGDAEALRLKGEAEGYAITKKAEADAEQMTKKSKALDDYKGAALIDMVMDVLPRVAGEISSALAHTNKITVVSSGSGYLGPAKITDEIFAIIDKVPEAVKSITGIDVAFTVQNKM